MSFFGAIFLALVAMAAFLLERFDVSVKVPEDIEKRLQLALLGTVPKVPKDQMAMNVIQDPRSVLSEAYYSIRTALQFSTQAGVPASLLITSARPHEGKSTTSVSVARAFARIGMRVLLIDGDMRDPSLHKLLGRDNTVGLSNILSGGVVPAPAVQDTDQENLRFLACGPRPPNPAELLSGDKLRTFVEAARDQFDLIVIDGPPVLGLADAPLLASWVLGTVLVVEAGVTKRELAKMAIRRLRVGRGHIVGAILNKFDIRKAGYTYGYIYGHGSGYGYGYDYGYRQRSQKKPRLFGIQLPDLRPGGRSGG
jgi:capsular exopolysaccharide synthesis family protein